MSRLPLFFVGVCAVFPLVPSLAVDEVTPKPEAPTIAPASSEGQDAIAGFKVTEPWKIELFAAEPDVANPVALYVDNQGRVFVCETFRQQNGVEDNRSHNAWLNDDLAAQSVQDRLKYFKKHLGDDVKDYTKYDDRIRLLQDTNGDGKADKSTIFAEGFNSILEGTGAGVLEHNGNVYYTCIPNLWLLRDEDGDGTADVRKSLHTGYGVRVAFRGHDMHGLIVGPDGRLYWSIGDRGYNLTINGKKYVNPNSGAVFRCEMDGSNFEVFSTGLRNPQELAFDDYGNLFTGDNNSDSGDKARWVYVVQGGDTGWRMEYQYLSDRGPFNREKIWHPYHEGQPAYIVPPIANFADGPSGLTYYPGVGLSDKYNGRFFLCDFRGGADRSGVRTFRNQPKGAFFEMVDDEQPLWNMLVTDIDFGPDGAMYASDWVHGWNGLGKGRVYRVFDEQAQKSAIVKETQTLLGKSFTGLNTDELTRLLNHTDKRVRKKAQFALASRRDFEALASAAKTNEHQLARIHAMWGLGQIMRGHADGKLVSLIVESLAPLLKDDDSEIRAQAARVLGDTGFSLAAEHLIPAMQDENLRVRYFAAQGVGNTVKRNGGDAIEGLFAVLKENANADPIVRHGAVFALSRVATAEQLAEQSHDPNPAIRLGAVLALRRQHSPLVALYLHDLDEQIVTEAARAIHDELIEESLPQLAELTHNVVGDDALLRRALNANFRLGHAEHAARIAEFAADEDATESLRSEAIGMLSDWSQPNPRDRVLGFWRPLEPRNAEIATMALRDALPGIAKAPAKIRAEGLKVAAKLGVGDAIPALQKLFADETTSGEDRSDALLALDSLNDKTIITLANSSLKDEQALVRAAARRVIAKREPAKANNLLKDAIRQGETVERQLALAAIADYPSQEGDVLLQELVQGLADDVPADTALDVLEAAASRNSASLSKAIEKYEASLPKDDPIANLRVATVGGNAQNGEKIFFERREVSCVRCHKIGDQGGEVGPDLSNIAKDKQRDYLLEAVALPNKAIAKNFESVSVATDEGHVIAGIFKSETEDKLTLMSPEGELIVIEQDAIVARRAGKSAMPEDLMKHLNRRELRDLVEFLSTLK